MKENGVRLSFEMPKYQTYPLNTAINGILDARNAAEIWLFNNYITLFTYKEIENIGYQMDFKYDLTVDYRQKCPQIDIAYYKVYKEDNIIDIIKEKVDEGKYIFASVDTYYIEDWWNDSDSIIHTEHQELVVGYNLEEEKVLVADFFKGKYSIQEVDNLAFRMAFDAHAGYERKIKGIDYVNVMIFEYQKNSEELDVVRIKGMINDFVESKETTMDDESDSYTDLNLVHGMDSIKLVVSRLEERIQKEFWIDYRAMHLVYIFNNIMSERLKYMVESGHVDATKDLTDVIDGFIGLAKKIKKVEMKCLKFNINKKGGADIIEQMKEVVMTEEKSMNKLNNIIRNVIN